MGELLALFEEIRLRVACFFLGELYGEAAARFGEEAIEGLACGNVRELTGWI